MNFDPEMFARGIAERVQAELIKRDAKIDALTRQVETLRRDLVIGINKQAGSDKPRLSYSDYLESRQ